MSWKIVCIKDISLRITKGTTPTSLGMGFAQSGINFIKAGALNGDVLLNEESFAFISKDTHNKLKRSQLEYNDVLITIAGENIGKCGLVRSFHLPANTNQAVGIIKLDKEKVDSKFVYYFFKQSNTFNYIQSSNAQAAQPNINLTSLGLIKINLPPLPIQQKIAKILSNYDDLIENNLKRIKLLEESGRLTYEEWFLRFCIDGKKLDIDPETKLPFGWQDVLLTDYIDLLRGVEPGSSKYEEVKTDSNIPFIRVGDLSKRDSDIYVSKDLANNKIIDKDDILLSLDGSPGKVRFGLSGCYSTGIRKAVSKQKNVSSIFIYNLLNSPYIQGLIEAYATGATILHAGSSVKKMRLVLPTDEVLDKYNNIEMKKFQLILNLSDEIKLLKEARDILLPRLMTGMIDTDDMDIAV
jgi:type I restriction enzyme S subunit